MQKNKYILIAIFVLVANIVSAQIFSAYSQYGLGIVHTSHSSVTSAMGGINAGFSDPYSINYTNPAALADIENTTIDIGLMMNGRSIIVNSTAPFSVANGGVNNVSMSFPIIKKTWGMSFGLLPYSFSKYKYTSTNTFNGESYSTSLEGKGSLYKLYLANGFRWKGLKAGINAEFIFGKLENSIYNEFSGISSTNGSRLTKAMSVRDVVFNLGAQYNFILTPFDLREKGKTNLEMTVGAYFAPNLKVDAFVDNYLEATTVGKVSGKPYGVDTAEGAVFNKYSTVSTPTNLGLGFNMGKQDKWNFGVDYDFKSWVNTNSPINNNSLTDEWKIKIGGSVTPDNTSKMYLNRVTYRFGSYYGKAPFIHENTGVSDFGITFGFGIPFARHKYSNRSLSNLNIAFEIGALGINKNQSLTENYYNFTLTYTLSDIWFRKQKFD